jgi:hypothetical protein
VKSSCVSEKELEQQQQQLKTAAGKFRSSQNATTNKYWVFTWYIFEEGLMSSWLFHIISTDSFPCKCQGQQQHPIPEAAKHNSRKELAADKAMQEYQYRAIGFPC